MQELEQISSNTRLAAFQCAYTALFDNEGLTPALLRRFAKGQFQPDDRENENFQINRALFSFLCKGIVEKREELDAKIAPLLPAGIERNDPLLVTLLRAGAFELLYRDKTPPAVVVTEYMKLADRFFPPQKVKLVNAVLDKLAQENKRP